jgi:hypothetical protein
VSQAANKNMAAWRGVLHWTAIIIVLLNAFAYGFATGAMVHVGASGMLSVVCSSADDQAEDDLGSPVPGGKPHCVACAIIHTSSAIESEWIATSAKTARDVAPPTLPIPIFRTDAIEPAPELRPLCSRAPPSRNV